MEVSVFVNVGLVEELEVIVPETEVERLGVWEVDKLQVTVLVLVLVKVGDAEEVIEEDSVGVFVCVDVTVFDEVWVAELVDV